MPTSRKQPDVRYVDQQRLAQSEEHAYLSSADKTYAYRVTVTSLWHAGEHGRRAADLEIRWNDVGSCISGESVIPCPLDRLPDLIELLRRVAADAAKHAVSTK